MKLRRRLNGKAERPLGWEIGYALAFKLAVLMLLWFAFFRSDPSLPRPDRSDLFTSALPHTSPKETENHVRR